MNISLFGNALPVLLAVTAFIAALTGSASCATFRFAGVRGWPAKLLAAAAAMAIVAALMRLLLGPYPTGAHPETQTGYGFAVYWAVIVWSVGFCVAIPVAHLAINRLQRRSEGGAP